ncbi:MAG: DNA-processing protein DprA [Deltaproteobacteria bacterium]|nr:DNA-processing protein DprA [Deltaproteobacteria bacterium]
MIVSDDATAANIPGFLPIWQQACHAGWHHSLAVRGRWPVATAIAVIGSRTASREQLRWAHWCGQVLAEAGICVVSGGALGVDCAALKGALDGGGEPLAILPAPPERPIPPQHAPVYARIVEAGGGLIGLADVGPSLPLWAFQRRNKLIAATVQGVVVVCGERPSGTYRAASSAMSLGRPVACPNWPEGATRRALNEYLLQHQAHLLTSADDLRGWAQAVAQGRAARPTPPSQTKLATQRPARRPPSAPSVVDSEPPPRQSYRPGAASTQPPAGLDPDQHALWLWLVAQDRSDFESMVAALPLGRPRLGAAVLGLTLAGYLRQGSDGCYAITHGSFTHG